MLVWRQVMRETKAKGGKDEPQRGYLERGACVYLQSPMCRMDKEGPGMLRGGGFDGHGFDTALDELRGTKKNKSRGKTKI